MNGKELRLARDVLGLKQSAMSEQLSITVPYLSNMERDEQDIRNVYALAVEALLKRKYKYNRYIKEKAKSFG